MDWLLQWTENTVKSQACTRNNNNWPLFSQDNGKLSLQLINGVMLLSNVTNRKSFRKFKMQISYTLVKYDKCHQSNAIHRIFTIKIWICTIRIPPHHNRFMALFRDHSGEPVQEEDFWTLWCKGKLTEADTTTIRLGATPSGLTSAHLHHPPIFFYRPDALPATQPTASKHWRQHIIHIRNSKKTQIISMTIL